MIERWRKEYREGESETEKQTRGRKEGIKKGRIAEREIETEESRKIQGREEGRKRWTDVQSDMPINP